MPTIAATTDQGTTQKAFDALAETHPEYKTWAPLWKVYSDLVGDTEADKADYLPKSEYENGPLYRFRLTLSEFIPECPLTLDKILGALYKQKPTRDIPETANLQEIMADADGKGTTWNDFFRRVAKNAGTYGTFRLLVNVNHIREIDPDTKQPVILSVAEEQAKGIRPFLVNYSPLSVIDWSHNGNGILDYVRIQESRWESVRVGMARKHAKITKFIEYDNTNCRWWEFRNIDGMLTLSDVGESAHNMGLVPMVFEGFPEDIVPGIGPGYFRWSARADVQKIRAESDLSYDTYVHSHPILKARVQEDLGSLGIGTNSYIKLDPTLNEDISYVETPASAFQSLREVIQMKLEAIQRHAGLDPLGTLQAGSTNFQASGASRAWSFETSEARVLTVLADKMESVERKAMVIALNYTSKDLIEAKDMEEAVVYADEFDTGAVDTLLTNLERSAVLVNSETLMKVLLKRLAANLAGEIPLATMKDILQEIEDNPMPGTLSAVGREKNAFNQPDMSGMDMQMMQDEGDQEDSDSSAPASMPNQGPAGKATPGRQGPPPGRSKPPMAKGKQSPPAPRGGNKQGR